MHVASEVYTADGKLIGRYYKENRSPIEFDKIAKSVVDALIATEDTRFFEHKGVDFHALISSAVSTVKGDKRGASTITQQLAKNLYSTRNQKSQGLIKYIPVIRTFIYKLKEWITAYKLEKYCSKQEILTLYLNTVPFGNNTYGIKTAAKHYFSKDPIKLKTQESATLIGMLKATTTYNPIKNPEKSLERRNIVLLQMQKYNYISHTEAQKLIKLPLKLKPSEFNEADNGGSYLRSAVAKYLEKWCSDNDYDLYSDGLKIYTTIDSKLQRYAEEAVASQMKVLQDRFENIWNNQSPWRTSDGIEIPNFAEKAAQRLPYYTMLMNKYSSTPDSVKFYLNKRKKMTIFSWNGDKKVYFSTLDSIKYYAKILNAGMMTFDPFNGHIKVWVGGIDHNYFEYDHISQAKRQAGSTFKPFVYLTALEQGMSPCDTLVDKPVKITYNDAGETKYWEPKNASFSFSGSSMSLRYAMARSVNSITAQLTEKVGWDNVVKTAHKCGIESDLKSVPSVGLGSNDVSVFEMVKAYGTFLNTGLETEPILVQRITNHEGKIVEDFQAKQERVLEKEMAWLMLYMLRGAIDEPNGTSQPLWSWDLWKNNNQIGGKTGTSSDYVDGWYIGLTKDLVTGIWVGCDERSAHFKDAQTGEGSRTALPIFGKFMEKVYRDPATKITQGRFPKPEVDITRKYACETPRIKIDTLQTDSLVVDSIATPEALLDTIQALPPTEK